MDEKMKARLPIKGGRRRGAPKLNWTEITAEEYWTGIKRNYRMI